MKKNLYSIWWEETISGWISSTFSNPGQKILFFFSMRFKVYRVALNVLLSSWVWLACRKIHVQNCSCYILLWEHFPQVIQRKDKDSGSINIYAFVILKGSGINIKTNLIPFLGFYISMRRGRSRRIRTTFHYSFLLPFHSFFFSSRSTQILRKQTLFLLRNYRQIKF